MAGANWARAALLAASAALLVLAPVSAPAADDPQVAAYKRAVEQSFAAWLQALWPDAEAAGVSRATFDANLKGLKLNWSLPHLILPNPAAPGGPALPASLARAAAPSQQAEFDAPVFYFRDGTLNALAVKSSGRLYHLTEPREMASILKGEVDLLNATLASDSFVEVVPAPGVQLLGADGIRADWHEGSTLRIPLGALHSGQHREALVRVRISNPAAFEGQTHPLASVRLRRNSCVACPTRASMR